MLAIKQNISHKRRKAQWFEHLRHSNQNVLEVRMTEAQYSSIIWLTQDKYTIVDNEDYELLNRWRWCFNGGYVVGRDKGKRIHIHRIITQAPKGMQTDHINGNKLDNRKANLRACSALENMRNRGLTVANKSGFKGVYWHKDGVWQSQIRFGGKIHYLGSFKDPAVAAMAYDKAALKLHGKFARTNKIMGLL